MRRFAAVFLLIFGSLLRAASGDVAPRSDYAAIASALEPFIRQEMTEKQLPAVSVALVDGSEIVWARGFGWSRPDSHVPATAATVYRAGSVSKLFTDIAIMQLVERGVVNLDAPVTRYLPDFHPRNPFGKPITLRELMSHRSGLVREPAVGHYFDPTSPPLAAAIASLNRSTLVYAPGTRTKYSNAGVAAAGYVLERLRHEPYAKYLDDSVLKPMGLEQSAFEPEPRLVRNLAQASIWTYDGRTFPAPTFELGIGPAGCLYTTVTDLGRFLGVLFARGRGPAGQVIRPATLDEMWRPQFTRPVERTGFGLGFRIADFRGHRMVGHGGAIYGFATALAALPNDRLGAVVITTKDSANAVVNRIARQALGMMLAARSGKALPVIRSTQPLDPAVARKLDGRYANAAGAFDLREHAGRLFYLPVRGGKQIEVRQAAGGLILDGLLGFGTRIVPARPVPVAKPTPAPAGIRGLIGEYGWDHDVLYILEKDNHLTALVEWYDYYPLQPVSKDVYRFPGWGLYDGETLLFHRGPDGRATEAVLAGSVTFPRRSISGELETNAHIEPLKPVPELRRIALAAQPPREAGDFRKPDLVEITSLDPAVKLDIRYAGTNNFMRSVFYPEARAFLQRPAAEALVRAHRKLKPMGYGLLIHDAYRPWYVTKMFWDGTPPDKRMFVADPGQGSRHNRGCAVDLTLYDLKSGRPAEMVGLYDEMSERSYPYYPGGAALARWNRRLLRRAMETEGFTVYDVEWWHFDYKDWARYPILNVRAGAF